MRGVVIVLVACVVALGLAGTTAAKVTPPLYRNCKALNAKYPHGVGRANARDSSPEPVKTFFRSTRIYNLAMKYNSRLDGDRDGVACEKA